MIAPTFIETLRSVVARQSHRLAQDIAGGSALVVILLIGLHLPGLT